MCQTDLTYSLVSGACPEMELSAIMSHSAAYHDKRGACLKTKANQNPTSAEASLDSTIREATQGDVLAVDSSTDLPVDVRTCGERTKPVGGCTNTSATRQTLMQMSELLASETEVANLLSGPQHLECTRDSCTEVAASVPPEQTHADQLYETNASTIVLQSDNLLYNFFTVPLPMWFYHEAPAHIHEFSKHHYTHQEDNPHHKHHGKHGGKDTLHDDDEEHDRSDLPQVIVKARGFVFVNVVDEIVLDKQGHVSRSGYHHKTKKMCDEYAVRMGCEHHTNDETDDYHPWNTHQGIYNHEAEHKHYYHLRTRITEAGVVAQNPGTHMLVNVLSKIDDQRVPSKDHEYTAAQCAATAFDFMTSFADDITGSYMVSNPYTSLRMRNYTWNGGQIVLGGGALELEDTVVSCGVFAANVQCPARRSADASRRRQGGRSFILGKETSKLDSDFGPVLNVQMQRGNWTDQPLVTTSTTSSSTATSTSTTTATTTEPSLPPLPVPPPTEPPTEPPTATVAPATAQTVPATTAVPASCQPISDAVNGQHLGAYWKGPVLKVMAGVVDTRACAQACLTNGVCRYFYVRKQKGCVLKANRSNTFHELDGVLSHGCCRAGNGGC